MDVRPTEPALPPSHIRVPRTARYYTIGTPGALVRDLWIVCHGFSQLAQNFAEPFRAFESDTRLIVAPEALSRFYLDSRPMHTQSSPVGATWMTRENREMDIADNTDYLDALYERLLESLANEGAERDRIRVHALGFSQGAVAVARWAALGSAVVDHLVLWGHSIPDDVNLRALGDRRPGITVELVYGARDRLMAPEIAAAQRAVLEGSGVRFRMREFDGGHVLSTAVLRELMAGQ
jgi:predicted esterase